MMKSSKIFALIIAIAAITTITITALPGCSEMSAIKTFAAAHPDAIATAIDTDNDGENDAITFTDTEGNAVTDDDGKPITISTTDTTAEKIIDLLADADGKTGWMETLWAKLGISAGGAGAIGAVLRWLAKRHKSLWAAASTIIASVEAVKQNCKNGTGGLDENTWDRIKAVLASVQDTEAEALVEVVLEEKAAQS